MNIPTNVKSDRDVTTTCYNAERVAVACSVRQPEKKKKRQIEMVSEIFSNQIHATLSVIASIESEENASNLGL